MHLAARSTAGNVTFRSFAGVDPWQRWAKDAGRFGAPVIALSSEVLDALGLVDGQWAAIESGKIANPRVIVVAALAEHYGADLGAVVNAQPTAALSPESRAIVRLYEDHLTPAPVCRS